MTVALLLIALAVGAPNDEDSLTDAERRQASERIEKDRPELVKVETIDFSGRKVTVRCTSTNPNAIANFVENIKSDPLFNLPEIGSIEVREGTSPKRYEFEMSFSVKKLN